MGFLQICWDQGCLGGAQAASPLLSTGFPPLPSHLNHLLSVICFYIQRFINKSFPQGNSKLLRERPVEVTENKANFPVSLSSEMAEALGEAEMAEKLLGATLLQKPEILSTPPSPALLAAACLQGCNQRSLSGTGG